jgi:Putative lumazine-binding
MRFTSPSSRMGRCAHGVHLLLASPLTVGAGAVSAQSQGSAADAATQVIQGFAQASDRSDAAALDALLHPSFRVVFSMGATGAPTTLERKAYLQMVRDGKIGGAQRRVAITNVAAASGFATAAAEMVRPDAVFNGVYSLIEQGGRWMLLQEAVRMSPTGAAK